MYVPEMNSDASNSAGKYYVYIVRCSDTSYYIGSTNNLARRIKIHNDGKGAKYTRSRRPVHLVYHETHPSKSAALRREQELKHLSRAQKQTLIIDMNDQPSKK